MAVADTTNRPQPTFIDKEWLRQQIAEQNAITGESFVLEPGMTPEKLQERIGEKLRARGIDPDTIRYEQKYEGE